MMYANQDITEAVRSLVPNASFCVSSGDVATIVWDDARPQPSTEELQVALDRVVANKEINALRKERNRRIAETDWWVLSDRTPTQAQLAYRQALRDITNEYSSLDVVVWPTKPE